MDDVTAHMCCDPVGQERAYVKSKGEWPGVMWDIQSEFPTARGAERELETIVVR